MKAIKYQKILEGEKKGGIRKTSGEKMAKTSQ